MPPHLPLEKGSPLPPGILPFQIMLGGGVAALALPRPLPVAMPLGRLFVSEELPWAAPKPWPPPRAVLSATGGVGAGVLRVGAVGGGVPAAGSKVDEAPKPVPGCVSEFAAAVGGGVEPRPRAMVGGVGAGVTAGGVAAAVWPRAAPRPAHTGHVKLGSASKR